MEDDKSINELKQKVLEHLKYLTTEESELLKMRWGIGYPASMTIHEIANLKNKSIDQIQRNLFYLERRIFKMIKK